MSVKICQDASDIKPDANNNTNEYSAASQKEGDIIYDLSIPQKLDIEKAPLPQNEGIERHLIPKNTFNCLSDKKIKIALIVILCIFGLFFLKKIFSKNEETNYKIVKKENKEFIDFDTYSVFEYEDIKEKTTEINFNQLYKRNLNNVISHTEKSNLKYFVNVYGNDDSNNMKILIGILNDNQEYFKEAKNNLPIMKLIFNPKIGISDFYVPEKTNNTIAYYLLNFASNIFLNKDNFMKIARKKNKYEYHKAIEKNITEDQKEKIDGIIRIENYTVKEINEEKISKYYSNKLNFEDDKTIFSSETKLDENNLRKSPIESYTTKIKSKLKLLSNKTDIEISKNTNKIINKIKFVRYESINFRNLEEEKNKINAPIVFNYAIFRSNIFGVKISLNAKVSFNKKNGEIGVSVIFNSDGEEIVVLEETKYTNYGEAINLINKLSNDTSSLIENNVYKILTEKYNKVNDKINSELKSLNEKLKKTPKFSNQLKGVFDSIEDQVKKSSKYIFNEISKESENLNNKFNQISNSIKEKSENNIKELINTSNNLFDVFFKKKFEEIEEISEDNNKFIQNTIKSIEYQEKNSIHGLNFDISTYYDIKNIINYVINIFESFKERINTALYYENMTYSSFVSQEFENEIKPFLDKVNLIGEFAKNNVSAILSFDDSEREKLINKIKTINININKILKEIIIGLGQSDIKNIEKNMKEISDKFNKEFNAVKENKNKIMDKLKEYAFFDSNFKIYIDDIKKLRDIENEIIESKRKSYEKYIIQPLKKIQNNNFLSKEDFNSFIKLINEYINKIINNNSGAEEIIKKFNEKISKQINEKLGNNLIDLISEAYTKENFLKKIFEDYYNSFSKVYDKYNTDFFENFKLHANQYLSRPTEMENKLLRIKIDYEKQETKQIEHFNELLISFIDDSLKICYQKIYKILLKGYNRFKNELKDNTNFEKLNEDFKLILNKFIDQKGNISPLNKFKRIKKDQFSLSKYISDNERNFAKIIVDMANEIKSNFNKYFCNYNTDTNCTFKSKLNAIQQYYYQIAKIRDSINKIMDICPMVNQIFNDSILHEFGNDIVSQIFSNVSINEGVYKILKKIDRKIKKDNFFEIEEKIKKSFSDDVKLDNYLNDILGISNMIFNVNDKVNDELKYYLNSLSGPFSKIVNVFNEELNYLKSKDFHFNSEYYKKSYDEIYKNIFQNYYNIKNTLNSQLKVPSDTISKHSSFIINNLQIAKNYLIKNILSILESKKCDLLSNTLSLNSLTNKTLTKYFSELENKIYMNISSIYNKQFSTLNESLTKNIDNTFEEVVKKFENEFNETLKKYTSLSKANSNNEIGEMDESTIKEIEKIFNNYFDKIQLIYSEENIFEKVENIQKILFNNLTYEFNFTNFVKSLTEDFNELILKCENIKNEEKNEFIKEFPNSISEIFNISSNTFNLEEVINYINNVFIEVYSSNFSPKFLELIQIINDNYDFINTILDASETKGLSIQLSKKLINMFPNLKKEITKRINTKLSLIDKKIDIFKYKINYKLLDKIMNIFLIKNEFSSELYDLIEKSFTQDFKKNIFKLSSEMIESGLINEIKDTFNQLVKNDLSVISKILDEDNKQISKAVSYKSQTSLDSSMITIRHNYEEFEEKINEYNMEFEYNLSDEKMNITSSLLKNIFNQNLEDFNNNYYKLKNEEVNKIMDSLNVVNLDEISKIVQRNVKGNDLNQIVIESEKKIYSYFEELSNDIKNIFSDFIKTLNKNIEDIKFDKFNVVSSSKENNNGINLSEINNKINLIEKQYINFNNKIFNSDLWISLLNGENNLMISLKEISTRIINAFKSNKSILKDYISQNYIDEKTNNKVTPVLNLINDYLEDNSLKLSDNLYNIQLKAYQLGNLISKNYLNSINSIFKKGIINIYQKTKALKSDEITGNSLSNQIKKINLYNGENDLELTINKINTKYGYSIEKENKNNFKVNVHVGSDIDLKLDYIIEGFYKNIIEGKIGSGEIGINSKYYIFDNLTEIDAYVKQDEGKYTNILQEFNYNNNKWEDKEKYQYNIPKQDDIHIHKVIKGNY